MSIFKVSGKPWRWYTVGVIALLTLIFDIWVYGFAGPFLISAADWFLVIAGVILCLPVSAAVNVFAFQVVKNFIKASLNPNKEGE